MEPREPIITVAFGEIGRDTLQMLLHVLIPVNNFLHSSWNPDLNQGLTKQIMTRKKPKASTSAQITNDFVEDASETIRSKQNDPSATPASQKATDGRPAPELKVPSTLIICRNK